MTYQEALAQLKKDGSNKAYRGDWNTAMTNVHIWIEKNNIVHADRDGWGVKYNPSKEALKANDWHVSDYGQPVETVAGEAPIHSSDLQKLL